MAAHYTHAQKHQAEWSEDREHLEFPNHSVGNPTCNKLLLKVVPAAQDTDISTYIVKNYATA